MVEIESQEWWGQLLADKDTVSIRELANRYGVRPGEIAAALRRTRTGRRPQIAPAAEGQVIPVGTPDADAGEVAAIAPRRRARDSGMPEVSGWVWEIVLDSNGEQITGYLVADDVQSACDRASQLAGDTVLSVRRLGPMFGG